MHAARVGDAERRVLARRRARAPGRRSAGGRARTTGSRRSRRSPRRGRRRGRGAPRARARSNGAGSPRQAGPDPASPEPSSPDGPVLPSGPGGWAGRHFCPPVRPPTLTDHEHNDRPPAPAHPPTGSDGDVRARAERARPGSPAGRGTDPVGPLAARLPARCRDRRWRDRRRHARLLRTGRSAELDLRPRLEPGRWRRQPQLRGEPSRVAERGRGLGSRVRGCVAVRLGDERRADPGGLDRARRRRAQRDPPLHRQSRPGAQGHLRPVRRSPSSPTSSAQPTTTPSSSQKPAFVAGPAARPERRARRRSRRRWTATSRSST